MLRSVVVSNGHRFARRLTVHLNDAFFCFCLESHVGIFCNVFWEEGRKRLSSIIFLELFLQNLKVSLLFVVFIIASNTISQYPAQYFIVVAIFVFPRTFKRFANVQLCIIKYIRSVKSVYFLFIYYLLSGCIFLAYRIRIKILFVMKISI